MTGARADRGTASGALLPTVFFVVTLTAILTSAVVPLMPTIAEQLDLGPADVSWVLTANILAAAVATPVLGRLADRRDPKLVLLAILGCILLSTTLCALWESFVPLVIGRALEGVS